MTQMMTALRRSPSLLSDTLGVAALIVMLMGALSLPGLS